MMQVKSYSADTTGIVQFSGLYAYMLTGTAGSDFVKLTSDGALVLLDTITAGSNGERPIEFDPVGHSAIPVGSIDIDITSGTNAQFTLWGILRN